MTAYNERTVTETYTALLAFIRAHRYPPSVTELAAGLYMSRSGVFRHIEVLETWGYIERTAGHSRNIAICNPVHIDHPPRLCTPTGMIGVAS